MIVPTGWGKRAKQIQDITDGFGTVGSYNYYAVMIIILIVKKVRNFFENSRNNNYCLLFCLT